MKRARHRHEDSLAGAFQEDHTRLGQALHRLGEYLRAGDEPGARASAKELDAVAGSHIAFEEEAFYPCLKERLGASEIDRLRAEHGAGLRLIHRLLDGDEALNPLELGELSRQCDTMEVHIAECGALFEAIKALPAAQQESLYQRLLVLRKQGPRWTEWALAHGEE